MEHTPKELHLHTVESLLKELISGRPVLIGTDKQFSLTSTESQAILNWYRTNPDKWEKDKQNREEDVKQIAKEVSNKPPQFPPLQDQKDGKNIFKYKLKEVQISQFGGCNAFVEGTSEILKFDIEKPVTLFQGHNGAGKTSLASAICWCLCGFVYRSQNPPQKGDNTIELNIYSDKKDTLTSRASIITPIPSAKYITNMAGQRVPLNTWVSLTFVEEQSKRQIAVKRRLQWKSNKGFAVEEILEGFDSLGLDPVALEVGTKIPDLIPYIQLGSASDLGNAIAELTGLRAISYLVKHASTSKQKLSKDLPRKINVEIEKINTRYEQKRSDLNNHFDAFPSIKPSTTIPLPNDAQLLRTLHDQIEAFRRLLNEALEKTKTILGEDFNQDANRVDLSTNVGLALDAIENHSLKQFDSVRKLGILKAFHPNCEELQNRIDRFRQEALEIEALSKQPDLESRHHLYARLADWMKNSRHDINICPVCLESLQGRIDPVTQEHIQAHIQDHVDNPKEFLRVTLQNWAHSFIDNVKSEFNSIVELNNLPESPHELIKKVFEDELFEKPCFKLSLSRLRRRAEQLVKNAFAALPAYNQQPLLTIPETVSTECPTLLPFLHSLQKVIAFAEWRNRSTEECKQVFDAVLGKCDQLPMSAEDYNLRACIETLQRIVSDASPLQIAYDKLEEMKTIIEVDRKQFEDSLVLFANASNALDSIIELGGLVDNQIETLMQQLSGRAKEWKERLYQPAYKGHPAFADSGISAQGALQVQAEIQGTRTEAQHISNSSDLRSTLLSVYFAFWEYLFEKRGGLSLIILDDINDLFDQRNFKKYSKALPLIIESGANLLITTNNQQFSNILSRAFDENTIQKRLIHPLSENREHLELGLYVEDIQKKKKYYEDNQNDDAAAVDYIIALRIYIEQQLGDVLCDVKLHKDKPTLGDYLDKIRSLNRLGTEPFGQDVFNSLINYPALKTYTTDFMELLNESHHGSSCNIAYNDITNEIKSDITHILHLIERAYEAYDLWLLKEDRSDNNQESVLPECPASIKGITFRLPLFDNVAAASVDTGLGSDATGDYFCQELLKDCAVYQLRTNNFGFSAKKGYKAIVKLSDDPIEPNSLVIALHKSKIFARRFPKTLDNNYVVLHSEAYDLKRRPPVEILPIAEVRLLQIIGFLFDEKEYAPDDTKSEASLLQDYRFPQEIRSAFKIRGESAIPLALPGQIILGGNRLFAYDFDVHIDKLVALSTDQNEQVFKRIGKCISNSHRHVRMFETISGLGNTKLFRTEEIENDPFSSVPLLSPNSVIEILGVFYLTL